MKNVENIYPLSPMQQGILFHTLYAPHSDIYIEQLGCTFYGELDVEAFRNAWQKVVERNPVMRTCFLWEDLDEPLQVVRAQVKVPWQQLDWRGLNVTEQKQQLEEFLQSDRRQSYDLKKAPLIRLTLMQIAPAAHYFIFSHHHLILDGWSLPLLFKELFEFYEAMRRGRALSLEVGRPFSDYIEWLQRQDRTQAEAFWRESLKGFDTPISLTLGRRPSVRAQSEGLHDEQQLTLPETTTAALQSLARRHELTLNTILQGAWALLLGRYSGATDVVFGATVAGRPTELSGVETMIGLFINTLPVRVQVNAADKLLAWLKALQARQTELRQYEYSHLAEVQGWSELGRGKSLFESILVFENFPVSAAVQQQSGSLTMEDARWIEASNYPLTVVALPGQALQLRIKYDLGRFSEASIERMLGHLRTLLESIAGNVEQRLSDLKLLTETERQHLLLQAQGPHIEFPQEQFLPQLIGEQAARTPHAIAVLDQHRSLTYADLDARANQLAHLLRSCGVSPDQTVGVLAERCVELPVALLGVLKAGAAYLPLEAEHPPARLCAMIEQSKVEVVVGDAHLLGLLADSEVRLIATTDEEMARHSIEPPEVRVEAENAAYVIYTSGSTGQPKGVVNTHGAILNRLRWMQAAYQLDASDRVLQKTPFGFDVSVWEFFWPLLVGARLVMARPGGHRDPLYLGEVIASEGVTVVHFVPSMLRAFLSEGGVGQKCGSVKRVVCSGEALGQELAEQCCRELGAELENLYGPTEAAVDVTAWHCGGGGRGVEGEVSIGRPIWNTRVYVLGEEMEIVPEGVEGELYIGGAGLARGYVGRGEQTAERFVPDPYSGEAGARLYRTGDVVRYRRDGSLEYIGRRDGQVKVRGLRIELGEVESVLLGHERVRECAVIAREEEGGDKRLVCYVVSAAGTTEGTTEVSSGEWRRYLRERLPEYMVPQLFIQLAALPLTPSGKLDRRGLPAPERLRPELIASYVAPRTPVEEVIAAIWAEVLGVENVGIKDDFFELGGHSLLAVRMMARVREAFHVQAPLRGVFEQPTVASLSERVQALLAAQQTDIVEPQASPVEQFPQTSADGSPPPISSTTTD